MLHCPWMRLMISKEIFSCHDQGEGVLLDTGRACLLCLELGDTHESDYKENSLVQILSAPLLKVIL